MSVKSSHACSGIELLGYRDEGDALSIESFHDLGEVEQRTCQPVDFINHHNVDLAGNNVAKE